MRQLSRATGHTDRCREREWEMSSESGGGGSSNNRGPHHQPPHRTLILDLPSYASKQSTKALERFGSTTTTTTTTPSDQSRFLSPSATARGQISHYPSNEQQYSSYEERPGGSRTGIIKNRRQAQLRRISVVPPSSKEEYGKRRRVYDSHDDDSNYYYYTEQEDQSSSSSSYQPPPMATAAGVMNKKAYRHLYPQVHIGDRLDDTESSTSSSLPIVSLVKIILGIIGVLVLIAIAFMILYIYDPKYNFICQFWDEYCSLFARGCDGWPASGKEYDSCGICGGNQTICSEQQQGNNR